MAATDIHAPQFTKAQVSRYLAHHPEARNYLRAHPQARTYLRRHMQGQGSTPLGPQARMAAAGVGESLTPIYGLGKPSVTVVPQSGTFPATAPPMLDGIVVDFTDPATGTPDGACTLSASVPGPASCVGPVLSGGHTESVSVDPSSQLPTGFIAPSPVTIALPECFPWEGPCPTVSAELQLPGTWRPVGLSVTNRATGQPVPGVTYVLCAPVASDPAGSAGDCPTGTVAEDTATSDADGSVQFSGLYPAGPGYRVLAADGPGGYIWDRASRGLDVPAVTDPANAGEAFVASMSLAPEPPSLTDDTVSVPENTTSAVDVLGNDSGGRLTLDQVTEPAHGDTSFADGSISYRPNTGFVGIDTFTYTASNSYGGTATATVTVTVTDVAPSVAFVKVSTKENQATSIDPMATVTTPEGATANVTDVSKPKHGTAAYGSSDSGAGELVYTPKPGFVGTDYFYYTVSDAHGATATAKVTVTVTDVAPRARRVRVTTHAGTPVAIAPLAKVQAPTGARLTVSHVDKPGHGSVTLTHGKLVYTPDAGFTGTDHFTYTVTDRHGGSADASVAIKVKRAMHRHGRRS